jgi:dTDP-4-dehydrorhamnose reductase
MKKILVTGSTGLLGTALVLFLKKSGYKIVTNARAGGADFLVDLADNEKSYEMLSKIKPDLIINLASFTNVELCQEMCNIAYLANSRVVENLTDWIIKTSADCHLIQVSTDHVYDSPELHIEGKVNLTNTYAFSKYAGELVASRVPTTILRTNFIGRSKVTHRESFSDWVYTSLTNGKEIQVLDDVYFSPLSINTLVEMIQLVIERKPVGIFNLGSHNGMSKADFSFFFAECLDLPTHTMSRIEALQATFIKTYRPKDMRMNCSKFENTIGVKLPQLHDEIIRVAKDYDEVS